MVLFILGLVLFVLLVVVHEFGHFIVARKNGVEVEEFGVGFPPRLLGYKRKGDKTVYSLNALPLGGFVQLKGESDTDSRKGSYGAASLKVKTKIMLAGVAMNLFTAFIMFTGLALIGMPQLIPDQFRVASDAKVVQDYKNKGVVSVAEVKNDSPAAAVDIQKGDQILSIDARTVNSPDDLVKYTQELAGKQVEIVTKRSDQTTSKTVKLNDNNGSNKGYLGVAAESQESGVQTVRSTWSAPIVSVGLIKQLSVLTFEGLGSLVSNVAQGEGSAAADQVTGPVGIVRILKDSSNLGLGVVLWLIAYISLTLAIMNLLPIPALDGGKLYTTLIYRALKKPLTPKAERLIYGTSFALLFILFILITIIDVRR